MTFLSPEWWPAGPWGAFWLFLLPIGPGTTAGILAGKNGGIDALGIAAIYLASDVLTAMYLDPLLRLARNFGRRHAWARAFGSQLAQAVHRTQLSPGPWGQFLSVALLSLGGGMATGAMALPGSRLPRPLAWIGVIAGDMVYFGLLLATALGLASIVPDDRLVFVGVLVVAMLAGPIIRRFTTPPVAAPAPVSAGTSTQR